MKEAARDEKSEVKERAAAREQAEAAKTRRREAKDKAAAVAMAEAKRRAARKEAWPFVRACDPGVGARMDAREGGYLKYLLGGTEHEPRVPSTLAF